MTAPDPRLGERVQTAWTQDAEQVPSAGPDTEMTLVDGATFAVSSRSGDIDGSGAHGLYMSDTRVLDHLVLTIDGHRVEALSAIANGPFSATFIGRTPAAAGRADSALSVIRRRHVGRGMREDLEIRNHSPTASTIRVDLAVGSDFASLFDVKSGHARDTQHVEHRSTPTGTEVSCPHSEMTISLDHAPAPIDNKGWVVELEAGGSWHLCTEVRLEIDQISIEPSYRCGDPVAEAIPVKRLRQWRDDAPRMAAGDPSMSRAVDQAIEDLGALRIFDPDHPRRVVVAAGAPWFMTLFGRDSILAAWMALIVDHDLARGVLHSLAELQGASVDPVTEEQPGRILHEVRFDAATARSLGGHNIYYGTIDATPLFVMLLAEYWRWTADRDLVDELLPNADRALDWIEEFGDSDGDGYVEYQRETPQGLENQGWKDSWDGIRHADGSIAEAPIALCEVQAYVYGAFVGRADLAEALGDHATASLRRKQATQLKDRFNADFWLDDLGTYAVGLDGQKQAIRSATSNAGHCLWTGIADVERSASVARSLLSPGLFSGWGLRTLHADNPGFNPLSYHCGSVWPHDTAIAVAGLARYGHAAEAAQLAAGLLDASTFTGGRLPELFAGFSRDDLPAPIPYPSSCSPQAWAAAAPLLVLRSLLDLDPNIPAHRVDVRQDPGPLLDQLRVNQVAIGSGRATIQVVDGSIEITGLDPDIAVATTARATRTTGDPL